MNKFKADRSGNVISLRNRIQDQMKDQSDTFRHLDVSDSRTYNWVKHSTTTQKNVQPHEIAPQLQDVKHRLLELVAESPSTEAATLEVLAHSQSTVVRQAVADNQRTPIAALRLLASDIDAEVRYVLAENHNVPIEILERLAEDDNPYVCARAQETIAHLAQGRN